VKHDGWEHSIVPVVVVLGAADAEVGGPWSVVDFRRAAGQWEQLLSPNEQQPMQGYLGLHRHCRKQQVLLLVCSHPLWQLAASESAYQQSGCAHGHLERLPVLFLIHDCLLLQELAAAVLWHVEEVIWQVLSLEQRWRMKSCSE